ncbi:hypothetical protein HYPBUDRAFT_4534 [Hyphopichia burtonii NRRL Y-1933]|uniref:ER transporter 6TM N-terminal domain-containing protein n=1 Tax=Hyphopichia burtonii NRRL Y-1933 TaxID=984485 RepID=A0A1E4RMF4_9ASCO|nr:hypothetical protein HYPBUDRAFT_4534 [Hyphopichia burtonii NRRL Y-1933]ODV68426.1 hypothetical protein HYPBUDRAFT_4534 [Hyphopichia burtonii NRRL Y-1933]
MLSNRNSARSLEETISGSSIVQPQSYDPANENESTPKSSAHNEEIDTSGGDGPFNVYKESDATSDISQEKVNKRKPIWRKYLETFRPGWFLDHLDMNSFRTAFSTWILVWITVIFCVIPKISHWLGGGAYLFQIMLFIIAPGGQLISLNLMVTFLAGFFLIWGWLFSVVAMAIQAKIRGWPTAEALLAELIQEGICTREGGELCLVDQFFTGRYLETRTTVVWIVALIIGMTTFGLFEKIHPIMRMGFVSAVIMFVIQCSYNVMVPIFAPTLIGFNILKPMGLSYCMRILTALFIFPFTSSYKYFSASGNILKALGNVNKCNSRFVFSLKPSADNFRNFLQFSKDITLLRVKVPALDLFALTARYEIAYSRFDPGNLAEYRSHLKNLISITAGFEYFYQLLAERKDTASNIFAGLQRRASVASTFQDSAHGKLLSTLRESYYEVGQFENEKRITELRNRFEGQDPTERVSLADLDYISEHIKEAFKPILICTTEAFDTVVDWIFAANNYRLGSYFIPSIRRKCEASQKLNHDKIVAIRKRMIDELKDLELAERSRTDMMREANKNEETVLTFISQSSLLFFIVQEQCKELIKVIDLFLDLDESRPKPMIITYFTHSNYSTKSTFQSSLSTEDPTTLSKQFLEEQVKARDPDALQPSNIFMKVGSFCIHFYNHYILNEHLWFWIRVGGLVTICSIPYYCRTTAGWYFSNRLIWLPITCAVSTSEYSAETIYMFVCKIVYSFLGSLVGLVAWYISTGKERGYLPVTAVVYFFLAYYRHHALHVSAMPSVMIAITPVLTLGTSWVDTYNQLANIGHGLRPAVTRFISVVIGLVAAFLATVFPKVNSSKAAVRKSLANALEATGNLHCNVTKLAMQRIKSPGLHVLNRHDILVERFRHILLTLAKVKALMKPIQYEVPLYGLWPQDKYTKLHSLINDVVQLYFMMFTIVDQVKDPNDWMDHIIHRAGWCDIDLTADIFSLVHMTSQSLRSKSPLPKVLSSNLSIKHLDILRTQWGINKVSLSERFYTDGRRSYETSSQNFLDRLDFDRLFSPDGRLNVVTLLLSHLIYKRLDQISFAVKNLVGEKYDVDNDLVLDFKND